MPARDTATAAAQRPAAAAQRAQVARALQAAQVRAQRAQKARGRELPVSVKLVTPTFRGERSVLLTIAGATVAIPAGARVSVGTRPSSALVLDREQIMHALVSQNGTVHEIAGLPREYVAELRSRAFPTP